MEMPLSMHIAGKTWGTWIHIYLLWQKKRTSKWQGSVCCLMSVNNARILVAVTVNCNLI